MIKEQYGALKQDVRKWNRWRILNKDKEIDLSGANLEGANLEGANLEGGLFKSAIGKLINADINGACNIVRKVAPKAFANGVEALGLMPVKINFS